MRRNLFKVLVSILLGIIVVAGVFMLLLYDKPAEMMNQARTLRSSGDPEKAADLFGKLALLYPDHELADDALYEQGFIHYVMLYPKDTGDEFANLRVAREAFENIVNDYPSSKYRDSARMYAAEIAVHSNKMDVALDYYSEALALADSVEEEQELHLSMADVYMQVGRVREALDHYGRVIEMDLPGSNYEKAFISIALYMRGEAEKQESGVLYQRLIALLEQLIDGTHEISPDTLEEALILMVHSQLELEVFEAAEVTLDRLESMRTSPTTQALVEDYRRRLKRQRTMGQ